MDELITPDELSRHAPGELTMDSAPFGWEGVRLRGYRYAPSDVQGPGMRDYLIVVCTDGVALTNRNCGNGWRTEQFAPGNVSLLTRAVQSHWRWNEEIEVTHLYLSPGAVANIAAQVYDRDAQEIELRDVLRADDAVLSGIITCLTGELRQGGVGGRLYVESLKTQACLHVLRHYANVVFREPSNSGGLSRTQHRLLEQFIDEHLEQDISLADLAGVVQLSTLHFTRKFRAEFGCPPYAYVMRKRIEHAKRQLVRPDAPLKVVAANCGFYDQSHMNRLFRRLVGLTPAEYRRSMTG